MSMQKSTCSSLFGIFTECIFIIIITLLLGVFSLEVLIYILIKGLILALMYLLGFSNGKRESLHKLDEAYLTGYQTGYNIGRSDQMLENSYYTFDKEHIDSSINKDTIVITDAKIE